MTTWDATDRLMIISSDAHAGALPQDYGPYLPAKWRDEFDAWRANIGMPWFDTTDDRNWDSAARMRAPDDEGVASEVIFPNTLPPFYDIPAHLSGVPRDRETFEHRWAGLQAHNRWLGDFCNETPDRSRADPAASQRRRRRGRRDALGRSGPRPPTASRSHRSSTSGATATSVRASCRRSKCTGSTCSTRTA